MWISSLKIENLRSFKNAELALSKGINVLVGPNNAGKSTVLRAIALLQPFDGQGNPHKTFQKRYQRYGEADFRVTVCLHEPILKMLTFKKDFDVKNRKEVFIRFSPNKQNVEGPLPAEIYTNPNQTLVHNGWICNLYEPDNFLFPFFSRRKPTEFDEQISAHHANLIGETFRNVYAKIDRIANTTFPESQEFRDICLRVFGFEVSCHASSNGKQAGLAVNRTEHIAISEMGEGTLNLLSFLSQVLVSDGNTFLIEELENDIHPKALKALLELIVKKSATNQFIISTHSNIVAKYAGALPDAKLFALSMKVENRIPTSSISEVPNTPESRIKVLEDLGYDLFDFELWKAYLILEESSAQSVIEQVLIPLFAPKLATTLKIIAASGNANVEARLHDFLRLFVYIHTSSAYKERAWVAVDGDEDGKSVVAKLKSDFKTWPESHFKTFLESAFERYYPAEFESRVSSTLAMKKGKERRDEKTKLALDVIAWAKRDVKLAKTEFLKSANEVIELLKEIESRLQTN